MSNDWRMREVFYFQRRAVLLLVHTYELWKPFSTLNFLKGINIDLEEGTSFLITGTGLFMALIYAVYKGYTFDTPNNVH